MSPIIEPRNNIYENYTYSLVSFLKAIKFNQEQSSPLHRHFLANQSLPFFSHWLNDNKGHIYQGGHNAAKYFLHAVLLIASHSSIDVLAHLVDNSR